MRSVGNSAFRTIRQRMCAAVRRLSADQRGNTMMIAAAVVFPLIAAVGGGLDLARAYLVRSRMNEACDAASLAGRRAMTNDDISTAQSEAQKFFNFNFPQSYLGSATFVPAITKPDRGTVRVDASTTLPTTLMRLFGYTTIPVHVTCDATQNFDNIDIMLVLDTTGSMAGTKLSGLQSAVMALYDELKSAQDQLEAQGLRLRYGIVPYSSAVNVGKVVYAQNPNYILSSNWTYQSRTPNFVLKNGNPTFSSWTYQPVSYNLANYVSGGTLSAPVGTNGTNVALSWAGCIEERQTTSSITSSTSSIPSSAYDLNIDLIPSSAATQWKPYLASAYSNYDSAEFYRTSSTNGYAMQKACPQQAQRLTPMSRTTLQSYVNSLYADGGTYHDIGMIWGARFLSPNGIFGSDNPSTYNGRPVHRYVIFMTDGVLDTGDTLYSSYGLEGLDKRVTGGFTSKSDQDGRHRARFLLACNAAKNMGASIWTIVFASGDDSTLQTCASSADQYALSADSNALIAKFKEIGKNIGALRLSQ